MKGDNTDNVMIIPIVTLKRYHFAVTESSKEKYLQNNTQNIRIFIWTTGKDKKWK